MRGPVLGEATAEVAGRGAGIEVGDGEPATGLVQAAQLRRTDQRIELPGGVEHDPRAHQRLQLRVRRTTRPQQRPRVMAIASCSARVMMSCRISCSDLKWW
ncbi:hypothetical protein D092_23270 [Rhodococcus ruber Chol-4]|nr:hypothetical protein D092_23270 [Rhodococcus ruber Chol-4]